MDRTAVITSFVIMGITILAMVVVVAEMWRRLEDHEKRLGPKPDQPAKTDRTQVDAAKKANEPRATPYPRTADNYGKHAGT